MFRIVFAVAIDYHKQHPGLISDHLFGEFNSKAEAEEWAESILGDEDVSYEVLPFMLVQKADPGIEGMVVDDKGNIELTEEKVELLYKTMKRLRKQAKKARKAEEKNPGFDTDEDDYERSVSDAVAASASVNTGLLIDPEVCTCIGKPPWSQKCPVHGTEALAKQMDIAREITKKSAEQHPANDYKNPPDQSLIDDLHEMADYVDDSHDHDELHAAASLIALVPKWRSKEYIRRWIDELLRLHWHLLAEEEDETLKVPTPAQTAAGPVPHRGKTKGSFIPMTERSMVKSRRLR